MSKRILAIGVELASDDVTEIDFSAKTSLLDWDIVLFRPDVNEFIGAYPDHYQGKPSLGDTASFQLKESCEHWRREIKQAVESGKTVIIFLSAPQEVYIDTGQRSYSGTGRNSKTTVHVASYSNHQSIPLKMAATSAIGNSMKLAGKQSEILSTFWKEFGSLFEYQCILPSDIVGSPVLVTKSGEKVVGSIVRSKNSVGSLVILPHLNFEQPGFVKQGKDGPLWTAKAEQFSKRFLSAIVALDNALHSTSEVTPEPTWASAEEFVLQRERALRLDLLEAERSLEAAQKAKESVLERLNEAGSLRNLLFEKGKILESAIVEALRIIGFRAAPYKDSASEFDVVFESEEGRFLGEAEGKDAKAISVDKLRQLSMNIHEDLQRESVTAPAKGVLFGNGFRLAPVSERASQFTDKCIAAAESTRIALISTSELYSAARYLADCHDPDFARRCRTAMLMGVGIVSLPSPPTSQEANGNETATVTQSE